MRKWLTWAAVLVTVASVGIVTVGTAQAAPNCAISWGSLPKATGGLSMSPLDNIRAGRHRCFDRLVLDNGGGVDVQYVSAVLDQARGDVVALRGGAFLEIVMHGNDYDLNTGVSTYNSTNFTELANVAGWRTFRQVSYGGSFEGYTTIGLGVRARLPFRVFALAGPGTNARTVIDVAHTW